jgi:hypothetical protein
MEDLKKTIRPAIASQGEPFSAPEKFQNETLRPILKMQNDLLLAIFRHFMDKRKVRLNGMNKEKRDAWIAHSLSNDHRLRGLILGAVIGHFTMDEWERYKAEEEELRKRLTNMVAERLRRQANLLV